MIDIVERLRKASLSEHGLDIDKELLDYAATEIERLRREAAGGAKGQAMIDIAERLRQGIDPNDIQETEGAMDRGAEEIERLRTQLSRLMICYRLIGDCCRLMVS